ncbi:hypothetical protein [Aliivibrio fischeri]|uniref:hypothetical protein n=1 Tax=Aliivibrio fischeri TaxID=668 RepID=UPI00080E6218|nr:hypothetical protein [Aliivibrio fischeri]OCH02200.1 hypothetical protein A6E10_17690 [Aliivibrio fischeri]
MNDEQVYLSEETKSLGLHWIQRLKKEINKNKSIVKPKVDGLKTYCSDFRYSRTFQIQSKRALMHR